MLGDQIKYLRHLHKISQVKLAEEIGVTKQTVSNWENNNIMPSVELLKKGCDFYQKSQPFFMINPSPSAHGCLCPFLSQQASFLPAPLIR